MNSDFLISFAYAENGDIVYRSELEERHRFESQAEGKDRPKVLYNCPGCNKKLRVKQSKKDNYHFSHFGNEACFASSNKEWSEYIEKKYCGNESEAHKKYKHEIARKLKLDKLNTNIETEKYIDGLRTDVYCERGAEENKKRLAFEIQISPLSIDTINKRTEHYQNQGIYLFWIVAYKDDKIRLQKDIEQYGGSRHIYEISDEEDKLFICHYMAPKVFASGKLYVVDNAFLNKKAINLGDLELSDGKVEAYFLDFDMAKAELHAMVNKANELATKPNRDEIMELKYIELEAKKFLSKPLFEQYSIIQDYVSWLADDEWLAHKNAIEAAKVANFYSYIKFHYPEIVIKKCSEYIGDTEEEWEQSKEVHYFSLPCPECKKYYGDEAFDNFILDDEWAENGRCENGGYEANLVRYLADLLHNGNMEAAAKQICHKEDIPYK